jgi:hypothetical protein
MWNEPIHSAVASALTIAFIAGSTNVQTPTPAANANRPNYEVIALEITVNRSAAEVWKRVGKFCDLKEWLLIEITKGCTIISGKDGEVGAVRSVANETMVGKTELSYTYTSPPTVGRPYNMRHGTLEAKPVTPTTSKLLYTIVYDNSTLADDAARERNKASQTTMFTTALANMKILAEGGKVPGGRE